MKHTNTALTYKYRINPPQMAMTLYRRGIMVVCNIRVAITLFYYTGRLEQYDRAQTAAFGKSA
ncbi:MAG: hypothetical protein ACTTI6_04340 [Treponema sp.]|uniref:hypothetical protein n=1 Tax=Treponema sp. TaxID=166 RepID=UPI003FA2CE9E